MYCQFIVIAMHAFKLLEILLAHEGHYFKGQGITTHTHLPVAADKSRSIVMAEVFIAQPLLNVLIVDRAKAADFNGSAPCQICSDCFSAFNKYPLMSMLLHIGKLGHCTSVLMPSRECVFMSSRL